MNKSGLSEAFGQEIKKLTAGTAYEVDLDATDTPDIQMDEIEARIRSIMYSLWMCAQAKRLAKRDERRQTEYFEQLYEFSYGVASYDQDYPAMKGTENIALMIIDEKQAFAKRIKKLYEEHTLFQSIMDMLDETSKDVLTQYFLFGKKVDYETLRCVLNKHLNRIEKVFKAEERRREEEADRQEEQYQTERGRIPVKMGRRKVYMTAKEYQAYLENEEAKRRQTEERWLQMQKG